MSKQNRRIREVIMTERVESKINTLQDDIQILYRQKQELERKIYMTEGALIVLKALKEEDAVQKEQNTTTKSASKSK